MLRNACISRDVCTFDVGNEIRPRVRVTWPVHIIAHFSFEAAPGLADVRRRF